MRHSFGCICLMFNILSGIRMLKRQQCFLLLSSSYEASRSDTPLFSLSSTFTVSSRSLLLLLLLLLAHTSPPPTTSFFAPLSHLHCSADSAERQGACQFTSLCPFFSLSHLFSCTFTPPTLSFICLSSCSPCSVLPCLLISPLSLSVL